MGYAQIQFTEQDLAPWNLTRKVTPAEEQAFPDAEAQLEQLGFDTNAKENWLRLWNAFDKSPKVPITVAAIVETAKVHKTAFIYKSEVQREYDQLSERFPNPADRDFIASRLAASGYDVDQSLLHNWNLVAKEFIRRGYPVTTSYFDLVLGNMGPLRDNLIHKQQPKRFDAQKAVEELKAKPKVDPNQTTQTTVLHTDPTGGIVRRLSPELEAHRKMVSEAMAESEARKNPGQTPEDTRSSADKYFEQRAKQFIQSIPEHVIRAEFEQLYSQPEPGESGSRFYWRVESAYQRRKTERENANQYNVHGGRRN